MFDAFLSPRGRREALAAPRAALVTMVVSAIVAGNLLAGCMVASESVAEEPSDPSADEKAFALEALTAPVPEPEVVEEALERLEAAVEEWRDGDARLGAHQADSVLALLPALSDWRPLVRAEMLAAAGDTAAVRESLSGLDGEGELWSRWGWRALAEAYEEADDPEGARAVARAAAESEWRPGRQASALVFSARLALAEGDSASAREDLRAALDHGDRYAAAREAAGILDRFPDSWTPEEELRIGRALLAARSWERGYRRLAPRVDAGGLGMEEDVELRLELARALHELQRYADAESVLSPLIAAGSDPAAVTQALYWSGRAAFERGRVAEAEAAFRELARTAPDSRLAEEGFRLMFMDEVESGLGPRARALLDAVLEVGVESASSELAVVQAGTRLYMEGDVDGAVRIFERYLEASRRMSGRQQAAYWQALIRERSGLDAVDRFTGIHADDPLSFYGVAAGARIGAPLLPADLNDGPSAVPGLGVELENALIRLQVHRLVPTAGSFAFELDRLTEHFFTRGDGAYDFAEALIGEDLALHGIMVGREIHRREGAWNLRLLRIVHPLPYGDAIVREAQAQELDPFFVAGVIRQESMFDARIQSPAGAVGLMQLMPATARQTAQGLGLRYSLEDLSEPGMNVRLGTAFLAILVRRFDGRAEDALAAYNAGPTRMRRWQQQPLYGDRDVFLEHVPFRETRHYVKVVQQYARIYTALYGCGDFEPCVGLSYREAVAQSPLAGGLPDTAIAQ